MPGVSDCCSTFPPGPSTCQRDEAPGSVAQVNVGVGLLVGYGGRPVMGGAPGGVVSTVNVWTVSSPSWPYAFTWETRKV